MFVNEAIIQPNKDLLDKFKEIFMEVASSGTQDPFFELNEKLKKYKIQFVDYDNFINSLPENERFIAGAYVLHPLGIRFLMYDPDVNQINIIADKSFDDKLIFLSK